MRSENTASAIATTQRRRLLDHSKMAVPLTHLQGPVVLSSLYIYALKNFDTFSREFIELLFFFPL